MKGGRDDLFRRDGGPMSYLWELLERSIFPWGVLLLSLPLPDLGACWERACRANRRLPIRAEGGAMKEKKPTIKLLLRRGREVTFYFRRLYNPRMMGLYCDRRIWLDLSANDPVGTTIIPFAILDLIFTFLAAVCWAITLNLADYAFDDQDWREFQNASNSLRLR